MKKIFIGSTKLAKGMEKIQYHSATKKIKETEGFYYGLSTVIENNLSNGDDNASLIILELQRKSGAIKENTDHYLQDLQKIEDLKGVRFSHKIIELPFNESKTTFQKAFFELIQELEENAEIYVDITFGAKTTSLLLFSFLQFAEKYFNCDVKMIDYVQRDYDEGEHPIIGSECIYDVTSLYYLNTLMNEMKCKNGTDAIETVKQFFSM